MNDILVGSRWRALVARGVLGSRLIEIERLFPEDDVVRVVTVKRGADGIERQTRRTRVRLSTFRRYYVPEPTS